MTQAERRHDRLAVRAVTDNQQVWLAGETLSVRKSAAEFWRVGAHAAA